MRTLLLLASILALASTAPSQTPQTPQPPSRTPQTPSQIQTDLRQALLGDWTGVLEYRDYSEPPTSTKRVQLPTWLSISSGGASLAEHFIYDDGPSKTVDSTTLLSLDTAAATYTEISAGKPAQVYKVVGYDALKSGKGELVLTGPGTENDKPTETRITLTIHRNLLSWTDETRPTGSTEPFAFRHRYTFTRSQSPATTKH